MRKIAITLIISLTLAGCPWERLPPDPGESGKKTLLGIDSNNNGIRDDVERHIILKNGDKQETIPLLLSYAAYVQVAMQRFERGAPQPDGYLKHALLHLDCVYHIDPEKGDIRLLQMMDVVTNTPDRFFAKMRIDKEVAGGKGLPLGEVSDKECQGLSPSTS